MRISDWSSDVCSSDLRMAIVSAIRHVSKVFREDSLELKRQYLVEHRADLLVMGDDWRGRFDEFRDVCEVRYLERTPNLSTPTVKAEVFHTENHARRDKRPEERRGGTEGVRTDR